MLAHVLKFSKAETNVGAHKDAPDPCIGTVHSMLLENQESRFLPTANQLPILVLLQWRGSALHHQRRGN